MKKIVAFLLIFTFGLSGCEKDDICDANTPTTPRLVIKFYDIADPATPKTVTNLQVIGVGGGDPNGIIFNENGTTTTKYLVTGNSITIPLRIDANSTTYKFILNSGSTNTSIVNTDVLTFNYTRQTEYVSRACGFKTTYTLNPNNDPNAPDYVLEDGDTGDGLWMQNVNIKTHNIELENETHVEILF